MRIAVINHGIFPFLLGGMERHTHFLATHLAKLGSQVDAIVPTLLPEQRAQFDAGRNPYRLIECPWPKAPIWLWSNYLYSRAAIAPLTANGYDAVYAQGFNAFAYLREVPHRHRAVTLLNMHGMEMFKTIGAWQTAKTTHMRWAAKTQVRLSDRVISSGGGLTEETRRFLRVRDERIDVIPNGVELEFVDRHAGEAGTRTGGTRPQFIFIGRLAENKGVHILCEAFARLPEAKLTIVGAGPLESELRVRFSLPNITFKGALDDAAMFRLLNNSDCFVFPSLYEGMPTAILEAMACGLPVIASDIGAVTTMVGPDNGYVIAPRSSVQVMEAVRAFQRLSPDQRKQMGHASRRKVEEQFAWPRIARRTLQVIERHVAAKRSRATAL